VALGVQDGASVILQLESHATKGKEERSSSLAAAFGVDAADTSL